MQGRASRCSGAGEAAEGLGPRQPAGSATDGFWRGRRGCQGGGLFLPLFPLVVVGTVECRAAALTIERKQFPSVETRSRM